MTGTRHAGAVSKTARGLLKRHRLFADEIIFCNLWQCTFWLAVDRLLGDTSGGVVPAAVVASSLASTLFRVSLRSAPLYVGHTGLHNASNMARIAQKTPNRGVPPGRKSTAQFQDRTPYVPLYPRQSGMQSERYGAVLRSTSLFNQSLTLGAFSRGTWAIALGSSLFAQKIDTILCSSRVDIWHDSGATNSLVAVDDENDIVLLLLDNDAEWNRNQTSIVAAIQAPCISAPNFVLLGDLNGNSPDASPHYEQSYPSERRSFWRGAFPNAFVFEFGKKPGGIGAFRGVWGKLL